MTAYHSRASRLRSSPHPDRVLRPPVFGSSHGPIRLPNCYALMQARTDANIA